MKRIKAFAIKYFFIIVALLCMLELVAMWFTGFFALFAMLPYILILGGVTWVAVTHKPQELLS